MLPEGTLGPESDPLSVILAVHLVPSHCPLVYASVKMSGSPSLRTLAWNPKSSHCGNVLSTAGVLRTQPTALSPASFSFFSSSFEGCSFDFLPTWVCCAVSRQGAYLVFQRVMGLLSPFTQGCRWLRGSAGQQERATHCSL